VTPARRQRSDDVPDGRTIITRVLQFTNAELERAEAGRISAKKATWSKRERQNVYAATFAKNFSKLVADALEPTFPGMQSGETPSQAVGGTKRVDVNFSTPEAGLGFAISLKSVHFGERNDGRSHFTHNMKRNDEELRVEATAHHVRQPYAVLAAVLLLPFDSCIDNRRSRGPDGGLVSTSSFASWVEYLWPLKGRIEPDDAPDRFELVFVALYERDGSELAFYEVGGPDAVPCPRHGRPGRLLDFKNFLGRIKRVYYERNGKDFAFEGESPPA
jgi:hypothetical protein